LELIKNLEMPTPHEIWLDTYFTAGEQSDPDISGDAADANSDGLSNIAAYAFNLDPFQQGTDVIEKAWEGERMTISFPRYPGKADLIIEVLASSSLDDVWTVIARSSNGGAT